MVDFTNSMEEWIDEIRYGLRRENVVEPATCTESIILVLS